MTFETIDVGLASSHSVDVMVAAAKAAEAAGYGTVWLAELYYARGLIATATAVALATKRIKIGYGIISPFARHPGVIATETATLDEISKGRMICGMGIAQIAVDRQGFIGPRPAVSLKEALEMLRILFAGKNLVYDGQFYKFTPPGSPIFFKPYRPNIPIHLGVMGEKSLQMAGRLADGVLLGMFSTPGMARWAKSQIEIGLKQAGRRWEDFAYRSYVTFSVDKNARKAKDLVRPLLAAYLSEGVSTSATNADSPRWKYSGVTADELLAVKAEVGKYWREDRAKAGQAIPISFIDKMIVAGEPDECRERIARYGEAGIKIPVPYPVWGEDPAAAIKLAAREVFAEWLPRAKRPRRAKMKAAPRRARRRR